MCVEELATGVLLVAYLLSQFFLSSLCFLVDWLIDDVWLTAPPEGAGTPAAPRAESRIRADLFPRRCSRKAPN
jgi:hypothetical protein